MSVINTLCNEKRSVGIFMHGLLLTISTHVPILSFTLAERKIRFSYFEKPIDWILRIGLGNFWCCYAIYIRGKRKQFFYNVRKQILNFRLTACLLCGTGSTVVTKLVPVGIEITVLRR